MADMKILEFLASYNIDFKVEHGLISIGERDKGVRLFESGNEYYIRNLPKIPSDTTETIYSISFKDFEEFKDIILKWYPFSKWDLRILPFNLFKEYAYKAGNSRIDTILSIYKSCVEQYTGNISLERVTGELIKYYHIKIDLADTDLYFTIDK